MADEELISLDTSEFFQKLRQDLDTEVNHSVNQYDSKSATSPSQQADQAAKEAKPARDVSKLLAEKMLAGWCMMGIHCPACNTPLMRSRQGDMFCEGCQMPVMHEKDVKASSSTSTITEEPEEETAAATAGDLPPLEPAEEDWENFGEKDMEAMSARMSKVDEISEKLGQYMLKGWTLMDIHCSVGSCSCPLVKSREGVMLCAACDTEYIEEGEEQEVEAKVQSISPQPVETPAESSAVESTKSSAAEARRAPPPTASAVKERAPPIRVSRSDWSDDEESDETDEAGSAVTGQATLQAPVPSLARTQLPQPPVVVSATPLQARLDQAEPTTLQGTEQALVDKLEWTRRQIVQASSITETVQLAKLVKELMDALSAIKQFKAI